MSKLPKVTYQAIGIVRSDIKKREHRDTRDVIAEIVLDPALAEGLDNLDEFSHIIVIYWLHKSRQPVPLKVHPMYRTEPTPIGVFSSRSPDRPNPLAISTVKLLGRRHNILKVQGLDAIDGSPVLDIKPHMPIIDSPQNVVTPPWIKLE